MNADAVISISALVATIAQLIRWAAPDNLLSGMASLALVAVLSAFGVWAWVFSLGVMVDQTWTWGIVSAWAAVMLSTAGIFGFVNTATNRPSGNRVD